MNWLVEVFGGQYRKLTTKGNRKQKYTWYSGDSEIPSNVFPYLILKKEQAQISIQFFSLGSERNPFARMDLKESLEGSNGFYVPVSKAWVNSSRNPRIEPTKTDWAYLSGLFDAEGSFAIQKRKSKGQGSYTSYARISNTDNRIFEWIVPRFGGRFSVFKKKDARDEGAWSFSEERGIQGRKSREKKFLSFIPYLVAKKDRAVVFLDWVRNNHSMSKEQKLGCFLKMRTLNKRGISQETNTVDCPNNGQVIESDPAGDCGSESVVILNS
jgi:hypothetical protein